MYILLCSETVEGSSLSLKSVDDVHSSDSLSLGVFSVRGGISNNSFQEALQDSSGIIVNEG